MALVSMKNPPDKKDIKSADCTPDGEPPMYPYGLSLSLGDESLKKLGMDGLPPVGTIMTLTARVKVDNVSVHQQADGDAEKHIGLQITDMELAPEIKRKSAAEVLYSKGD